MLLELDPLRDQRVAAAAPASDTGGAGALLERLAALPLQRRCLRRHEHVFRTGQRAHALYLVNSGCFMTSVVSPDGREKVTGFRMRRDLLGLESQGAGVYGCDAVALDTGEVWVLPQPWPRAYWPAIDDCVVAAMADELRRDWAWMLNLGTLGAEQRVIAFLLDFMDRLERLGFSGRDLLLRMTRADLGNFLAVQLETVTRALSNLQANGLIDVNRREIRVLDRRRLQAMLDVRHPLVPGSRSTRSSAARSAAASCSRRYGLRSSSNPSLCGTVATSWPDASSTASPGRNARARVASSTPVGPAPSMTSLKSTVTAPAAPRRASASSAEVAVRLR